MNQKFYELAKKIADWHTVTFKDADKAGQLLKLDEEFDEWRAETDDHKKQLEEIADCFIVASALWFRFEAAIGMFICKTIMIQFGNDELYDAIQKKMTINFNRSWKKQANGSYHH